MRKSIQRRKPQRTVLGHSHCHLVTGMHPLSTSAIGTALHTLSISVSKQRCRYSQRPKDFVCFSTMRYIENHRHRGAIADKTPLSCYSNNFQLVVTIWQTLQMIRLWATYLGGISDLRLETLSLLERTYMKMLAGVEFCMWSLLFNITFIIKTPPPLAVFGFRDVFEILAVPLWNFSFLFLEANVTSKTCGMMEHRGNLLREMVCWVMMIRGTKHSLSSQALSLRWPWTHAFPCAEPPCWCPCILGWGKALGSPCSEVQRFYVMGASLKFM